MIKKYFDHCLRDAFNIFYSNILGGTDPDRRGIKNIVDMKIHKNMRENYRKTGRYTESCKGFCLLVFGDTTTN